MATSMRARLRQATDTLHRTLERDLALEGRIDDVCDVRLILARFHGFFSELERALDRLLGPALMDGRHRLGDLAHDLTVLGLTDDEVGRLPACREAGDLDGEAAALGALYVAEGARLGGRTIARSAASAAWWPDGGLRFWSDAQAGEAWRSLVERLEAVPAGSAEALEGGATATFARLHAWMASGGALA